MKYSGSAGVISFEINLIQMKLDGQNMNISTCTLPPPPPPPINGLDPSLMQAYLISNHTYRSSFESILYLIEISNRAPTFSNKTFVSHIQVKHIHCVVDCLNFPHLYKIHTQEIFTYFEIMRCWYTKCHHGGPTILVTKC